MELTAPLDLRFAAARALAPYVHPRLASAESRIGGRTHEDRLEEYRKLLSDDDELWRCAPPARWPTEADDAALSRSSREDGLIRARNILSDGPTWLRNNNSKLHDQLRWVSTGSARALRRWDWPLPSIGRAALSERVRGSAQICVAASSTQTRVVMRQPVLQCRRARPDCSRKAERGVCRTMIGTRTGAGAGAPSAYLPAI
jgi:hypothetical protein